MTSTVDVAWMLIVLDGMVPSSARWTYVFPSLVFLTFH
jgi:hypothetical protein